MVRKLLVTHKKDENFSKEILSASMQAEPAYEEKKILLRITIVMQQATFQGMEKIINCIDAHVSN